MLRELLPVLIAGLVPFAILTLIVVGTAVNLVAWQPPILQTTQFGTANSENGITGMASNPTGVYASGLVGIYGTGASATANVTPSYMFVSKFDSNARQVWTQRFGNASDLSRVQGVGVGANGIYAVGALGVSANSSFVRKYDLNGNQIWDLQFGNTSTTATAISVAASNVYVAGLGLTSSAPYFLRSYDLNGGLIWSLLLGNNTGIISVYAGSGGVFTSYDALYTASEVTSVVQSYDPHGTLLWTRTCSCESTGMTGDPSGVYLAGLVPTSAGVRDGFLGKYSLSGVQLWTTSFKAPGFYGIESVEISADSTGIYLASTTSNNRGFVMKYAGNGELQWSVRLPWTTGWGDISSDAIAIGGGHVYVGGELRASTGYPAFVASLSQSSSLIFFGTNPPFSFGILALLVAVAALSILFFRKRSKTRSRLISVKVHSGSRSIPADVYDRA